MHIHASGEINPGVKGCECALRFYVLDSASILR
jgi:hypothetical protein